MALTDNLAGYWKLDEASGNAVDSLSANTLTNTDVTYTAGKINNCASFNGSTAKLLKTSVSSFGTSGNADKSVSVWYNPISNPSSGTYDTIFCFGTTAALKGYALYYRNNGGTMQLSIDFSGDQAVKNQTLNNSTWYHIVVVYTASNKTETFYVNGSSIGSTAHASNSNFLDSQIQIGSAWAGEHFANGLIDEVGFWNIALSSAEVTELYNGGTGLSYPFVVIVTPVAAFTASVTSGYPILSVTFTDTSTNTPTSWSWKKDDGSGYTEFSTSQNPVESFVIGSWDIKLTATNSAGSDDEEKLDYITVTQAPITILPMSGTKHRFSNSWKFSNRWKFKFF